MKRGPPSKVVPKMRISAFLKEVERRRRLSSRSACNVKRGLPVSVPHLDGHLSLFLEEIENFNVARHGRPVCKRGKMLRVAIQGCEALRLKLLHSDSLTPLQGK